MSTDPIGIELGPYKILSLLGQGGMGAVYLAENARLGRRAAVKVLLPQYAVQKDIVDRFFNEARAANLASHQGIVDIYDYGEDPRVGAYLVMEYLEGESLEQRLLRNTAPMDLAETLRILERASIALTAAHERGIVHRDLKPGNIFLVPDAYREGDELVKLLDFGIAKLADAGMGTQSGVLMGTPAYMSPEQCDGAKHVDHRSDIYALGIIAYEMLTGRPPFVAEGGGRLMSMQLLDPPPPPRSLRPELPEAVEAVLLRALAKKPDERFERARDFAEAMIHAAKTGEVPAKWIPTVGVGAGVIGAGSAGAIAAGSSETVPQTRVRGDAAAPADGALAATGVDPRRAAAAMALAPTEAASGGAAVSASATTPAIASSATPRPIRRSRLPLLLGVMALLMLLGGGAVAYLLVAQDEAPPATLPQQQKLLVQAGGQDARASASAPDQSPVARAPAPPQQQQQQRLERVVIKGKSKAKGKSKRSEPDRPAGAGVESRRPLVRGSLSVHIVRRIMSNRRRAFRRCYRQGLRKDPSLRGAVTLGIVIGPSGQVSSCSVKATSLHDKKVERCLVRVARRTRFPRPRGGGVAHVNYPLHFASTTPGKRKKRKKRKKRRKRRERRNPAQQAVGGY